MILNNKMDSKNPESIGSVLDRVLLDISNKKGGMQMKNSLIRQLMARYGLHQCDLARLIGVHEGTISKWLNKSELSEQKQMEIISIIKKEGENREQ